VRLFETASAPVAAARYLLPHEQSVITVRQHPAKLLPALTAAAGGLLAAVAVGVIREGVRSAHLVVWALAGLLILRFFADVMSWSVQYIVISEKRLILTSGLFGRRITVVPLPTLKDLAFARSTGGRLLGYGAFTFEGGGKANAVIDYIPYPEQIYLEIYGLLYPPGGDGNEGSGD
jgi:hypothetical protein